MRDLVAKKQLHVHYISTDDQVAALLTKALPKGKFLPHRSKLIVGSSPINLKGNDVVLGMGRARPGSGQGHAQNHGLQHWVGPCYPAGRFI